MLRRPRREHDRRRDRPRGLRAGHGRDRLRGAIEEARIELTFEIEDSQALPAPLTRQETEAVGRKEVPELVLGCDTGPARFRQVVVLSQLPGGTPSKTDAELGEPTREANRGDAPRVRGTSRC